MLWFQKKLKFLVNDKVQCDFCCTYMIVSGTYLRMGAGVTCKDCAWTFYNQLKKIIENEQASKADAVQKPDDGEGSYGAVLHDISKRRGKDTSGGKGRDKPT